MQLAMLLKQQNLSTYQCSKVSGIPYTTLLELVKGKTSVEKCAAETIYRLASALNTTMDELYKKLRSAEVRVAFETFKNKLKKNNIKADISLDNDIVVYARYSTLCQVLVNLFDNSVYWLSFVPEERRCIHIKVESRKRIVIFGDSGKGIDDAIRPYLFEAGYSMKIPPSGLGLYICKSYMSAMKGTIYETPSPNRLGYIQGAQFTIDFNHVPSRKEDAK